MDFYRHLFLKPSPDHTLALPLVYLISIIFTFQSLLTAYSSSTYLEQFIKPAYVGLVFAAAAFGAIVLTLLLPRLLRAIGNVGSVLLLMILMILSLILTGLGLNAVLTLTGFIAFNALYPQIYLNIDIFLETITGEAEGTTGSTRGIILTLMSMAAFFAPLSMGYIIGDDSNLGQIYYVAAAIGFIFIGLIIAKFRHFYDPEYNTIRVRDLIKITRGNTDINTVMSTQFLLQFFYTWAVIYIPLYLATNLNFTWEQIGYVIAAGLFAFVLFEYPIGLIADHHWGEKEMMAVGFCILAIASAFIFTLDNTSLIPWMILMFFSRIGASLVEVTTESYFFKQVKGHEANLISLFRLMRPLGNLLGAIAGSIALVFFPLEFLFIILALIMASGAFITLRLTDTR